MKKQKSEYSWLKEKTNNFIETADSLKFLISFAFVISLVLAGIELFNTYLLYSNYENPPSLIPYPTLIKYLSFSFAVPSIWIINVYFSKHNFAFILAHISTAITFVTAHIFISNISDWFFFDRDWTLVGSFQFVFTTHFLFEIIIYCGLVLLITFLSHLNSIQNVKSIKNGYSSRLEVTKKGKTKYLDTDKIIWIEANDNYLNIHSEQNTFLIRNKLKDIVKELDPALFQQIHRSYIINLSFFKDFTNHSDGGLMVTLTN